MPSTSIAHLGARDEPPPGASGSPPGDTAATRIRARVAERLQDGDVKLPLLPESASQVLAATQNTDVDARQLIELLGRDPVLASQVLRMANSPAYATRGAVLSLRQAITLLGLRTIGDLALAASLRAALFDDPRFAREGRTIWAHATASAAFAREAARLLRASVETAFLCGLLHTIGKPFALRLVLDAAAETGTRVSEERILALVEELHAGAGQRLAAAWRLPRPVVESIALAARYARTDAPEPMISALASRLAAFLLGPGLDADGLRDHPVIADLNLYPEDVDQLVAKGEAVIAVVDAFRT